MALTGFHIAGHARTKLSKLSEPRTLVTIHKPKQRFRQQKE
jgi:hypothetical protein